MELKSNKDEETENDSSLTFLDGWVSFLHLVTQEPITKSEQLPYLAYVRAFLRTSSFLDTFYDTFSRENRISTPCLWVHSKYKISRRKISY